MGKYTDNRFIDRLEKLRGGREKKAFAESSGIHPVTMLGYLNGSSQPNLEKLRTIAEHNGVTVGWLVDDETVIYRDAPRAQRVNGSGNVTTGDVASSGVNISTGAAAAQQRPPRLRMEGFLDEDEIELITMLRDFGGKRMLQRFKSDLIKIQRMIDEE